MIWLLTTVATTAPIVAPTRTSSEVAADAYVECIDRASTNPEWAGCGGIYLKGLDDVLNASWKKAYASLVDKKSRMQLLKEQRAWIKFKDGSCDFYANGSFGREGQVLHFFGCRAAIISARINDLNGVYDLTHQDED